MLQVSFEVEHVWLISRLDCLNKKTFQSYLVKSTNLTRFSLELMTYFLLKLFQIFTNEIRQVGMNGAVWRLLGDN